MSADDRSPGLGTSSGSADHDLSTTGQRRRRCRDSGPRQSSNANDSRRSHAGGTHIASDRRRHRRNETVHLDLQTAGHLSSFATRLDSGRLSATRLEAPSTPLVASVVVRRASGAVSERGYGIRRSRDGLGFDRQWGQASVEPAWEEPGAGAEQFEDGAPRPPNRGQCAVSTEPGAVH